MSTLGGDGFEKRLEDPDDRLHEIAEEGERSLLGRLWALITRPLR